MDGDVEKGDLSSGYDPLNRHTVYQLNGLKPLMNYNGMNYMQINDNLHNLDVSSGTGLINSHTLPQYIE